MKYALKDTSFLRVLGFKKQLLALTMTLATSGALINIAEAAPTRNINPPTLKADAPNVYVVKKGDTLWDISKKFLKNPYRWPEIWASNRYIKNPHWIFPGDRLLMCTYNGQPIIGKDEGDGCTGIISRYGKTTINLQPQVRIESLNNSIPIIPLEKIKVWLEKSTILPESSLKDAPYVVGMQDDRIIAAEGQNVYVRGQGLEAGQRYGIYAKKEPYMLKNAEGKKFNAGIELIQVASGIATQQNSDITTLALTQSYNAEVRPGYLVLLEQDAMLPTVFYPVNAEDVVNGGEIVRVQGSIGSAAVHSVVTIDRGKKQGVKSGQVFNVNQAGQIVKDPMTHKKVQLPSEKVGTILVFRTFDDLSYAYVLESQLPIRVGSLITPPVMTD